MKGRGGLAFRGVMKRDDVSTGGVMKGDVQSRVPLKGVTQERDD